MRKVVLYIAMSLDGYIADRHGKVDWLTGQDENDMSSSYSDFIKDVDTVIMGWKTYHQIVTELSPEQWVYQDMKSYVITHRDYQSKENIEFVNQEPCEFVKQLKQEKGKSIWICGGAHLVQQLMKEDIIDRYHISIIPTLLGSGISLFQKGHDERKLQLIKTQSYNGIVDLIYERR